MHLFKCLLFLQIMSISSLLFSNTVKTHIGKAYLDEDHQKLLYTEKHRAYYEGKKLIRSVNDYFLPDGTHVAVLESDYRRSLVTPTYIFESFQTGLKEGLLYEDGHYYIFMQEKGKEEQRVKLESVENIFSCQGWHYYLVENFERIQKEGLKMNLIFPSKLDYYSFDLKALDSKDSQLKLRLQFRNWFLRLFAPHLDLSYDKEQKRILSYAGPSNLLSDQDDVQHVYILYSEMVESSP